jgi:peptidoglycan/xylan/chitin deacetylase (PgdA/CDA1 family)
MYHAVEPCGTDPFHVCLSPDGFARQMRWLADRGLTGVSVRELRSAASQRARHLVGLTFDDAYAALAEHAVPTLRAHGFTATVFAVADRIGGWNDWDEGPRRPLMDESALRELAATGIEVGSHGLTHTRLSGLPPERLAAEVAESRVRLGEIFGAAPEGFCYPYGDADAAAVEAVREAGYAYACGVRSVPGESDFALPRTFVGEADSSLRLGLKRMLHRVGMRHGSRVVLR